MPSEARWIDVLVSSWDPPRRFNEENLGRTKTSDHVLTGNTLGLLPIAVSWGQPGSEIEGPMALVILGGLVTTTALNRLGLPVLYRRLGDRALAQSPPERPEGP